MIIREYVNPLQECLDFVQEQNVHNSDSAEQTETDLILWIQSEFDLHSSECFINGHMVAALGLDPHNNDTTVTHQPNKM